LWGSIFRETRSVKMQEFAQISQTIEDHYQDWLPLLSVSAVKPFGQ